MATQSSGVLPLLCNITTLKPLSYNVLCVNQIKDMPDPENQRKSQKKNLRSPLNGSVN